MRSSITSLTVGVVLAVLAVFLMYNFIQTSLQGAGAAAPAIETGTIVVAVKDLPFGTTIERLTLKTASWPKASIPQGAFSSIDEVYAGATRPGDRIALVLIR